MHLIIGHFLSLSYADSFSRVLFHLGVKNMSNPKREKVHLRYKPIKMFDKLSRVLNVIELKLNKIS